MIFAAMLLLMPIQDRSALGPPAEKRQDAGTCDGKCKDGMAFTADIGVCRKCKGDTPSGGIPVCTPCSEKHKICRYCMLPIRGSDPSEKIQKILDAELPGHKVGRKKEHPLVGGYYLVIHPGSPCKTCEELSESLVVFEKDRPRLIRSEKDLEAFLVREKIKGKPAEVALRTAELVQALWQPIHGGLDPDVLEKVVLADTEMKDTDHIAKFEYKKGHAYWALSIGLRADGSLSWLNVSDTGRRCR